jgi:serine-type D-Ala-D-Ala carboxypeptidase/endopeptidase (penicillin-binding protein 4)
MRILHVAVWLFCLQQVANAQNKEITKWAEEGLLKSAALKQAHTGICIYEPATGRYWYNHEDDKYFTPASNTKIFTLYTGLKYLGDSLPALRYLNTDTVLFIKGTGDPSFLHPDYTLQRAIQLLTQTPKRVAVVPTVNENKRFGPGWAWDDYSGYFQPELNELPMYGNVVTIKHHGDTAMVAPGMYEISYKTDDTLKDPIGDRDELRNRFTFTYNSSNKGVQEAAVPFITGTPEDIALRLQDTLHKTVAVASRPAGAFTMLNSIPADSLYTPMMHRSDNFFAEQTLMMCAASLWDTISTDRMIDYMLHTYLSNLPDAPQWVDGSGLSRYNLFTPRDFVSVLTDMYKSYSTERLFSIFPTGGKGTLKNYYKEQFVHAKTGTLSNCVALSGYLITRKKKTLVFSVLVNNHNTTGSNVRRTVESFLTQIYEKY